MNFRATRRQQYLESFNFSSLTDVVMQLLIFFLLTFSFASTLGMNVTLPKTSIGQPPQRKTISISLSKDKIVYLNSEAIPKDQIPARVAALLKTGEDQQIVIRADKDLILQDVIEVLDLAKSGGATRLFIATDADKESK